MDETEQNTSRLGRPRSEEVHKAILEAALAILKESGYKAVTMEAIAARAKVGKQTIYRWWSSKAAVVLEACTVLAASESPVPQRGSLRENLREFLGHSYTSLNEWSGPVLRGLMAEAQLDPIFAKQFWDIFIVARRDSLRQILKRGVTHSELPATTDVDFLLDVLFGVLWYRLLLQNAPLDMSVVEQLINLVQPSV